ncbi:MAG: glucose-6-phosphate dehydrogenase [Patescibacteria group bacterium]
MYTRSNTLTTLIIFGATGDLSRRRILPAFFDLYRAGCLPEEFRIVGFARGERTDDEFRAFVRDATLRDAKGEEQIEKLLAGAHYTSGLFDDPAAYEKLARLLIDLDERAGQCANKLFYLAVPPAFYETIFQNLADSGLSIPCSGDAGWTRIIVEKPFGNDLRAAEKLDRMLGLLFKEEQIFRIDHYLAKESLQNIIAFRFANTIFQPLWNACHIERVEILMHEAEGVQNRGEFYDAVGALRDVGQNHILQMLALIAMEDPGGTDAGAIQKARADVFEALQPIALPFDPDVVRRGQYKGYTTHRGIRPDSDTETYFRITAHIANKRWRGVPFILESGKKMHEDKTRIRIVFKENPSCITPGDGAQKNLSERGGASAENASAGTRRHQNELIFGLKPKENISILFWAKKPGFQKDIMPRTLSFAYAADSDMEKLPEPYERILYDCIRGDRTLFASTAEVMASWRFITPILDGWRNLPLIEYDAGWDGTET